MKIRKATKEDARRICNLKKETFKKINSKDYSKKFVDEYLKKQSTNKILINMKKGTYFILEDKNKILGCVQLYDKNVIGGMYVKYNQVGKGYGNMLMNFIENYAKKRGIKKVVLYSTITAKKFYEKLGYKKVKGYHNKMEKKLR